MKDETKCEIETQGQMSLAVRFSCCATFPVDYENTSIELLSTRQPAMFCQMQLKQSSSKAASFQIRVKFFTLPNKLMRLDAESGCHNISGHAQNFS